MSNNGDRYRLVTSTTLSNLSDPNCSFTDQGSIVTITVIECGIPLQTPLIAFTGNINQQLAVLNRTTTGEDKPLSFEVEKSMDGINFTVIATMLKQN